MKTIQKGYIGDGVYVELDHDMICLMTKDGISITNKIYMYFNTWHALKLWVEAEEKQVSKLAPATDAPADCSNLSATTSKWRAATL